MEWNKHSNVHVAPAPFLYQYFVEFRFEHSFPNDQKIQFRFSIEIDT